jgi:hypothetical protein
VSDLGRAILAVLDDEDLAELARRLPERSPGAGNSDGWLSTRDAAAYAGCTTNALHRAMAAREVEFEQSTPGGKAWFKRSAIDAWRRSYRRGRGVQ